MLRSLRCSALSASRDPSDIRLLAVSKSRSEDEIRRLAALGQIDFGENYVTDAVKKMDQLIDIRLTWHFIGTIQSNKTRAIAQHFDWVHSVDRVRVAHRLDQARGSFHHNKPLNICIQVNVDDEAQKSGVLIDEVESLARQFQDLPNLRLRGLMALPKPRENADEMRMAFRRVRDCFLDLRSTQGQHCDTLSMGMSADYSVAIEEGATIVRIGTAIFGPRT